MDLYSFQTKNIHYQFFLGWKIKYNGTVRIIFYILFSIWYGLLLGKNYREYCNKQALICNRLRTVSKIGGDTGTFQKIWATEQLYTVWGWMIASRTLRRTVFEGELWGRKQKSQSVWLAGIILKNVPIGTLHIGSEADDASYCGTIVKQCFIWKGGIMKHAWRRMKRHCVPWSAP